MIVVWLPLVILAFKWKEYNKYDWCFTFLYILYAWLLVIEVDIPLSSRIGSFYLGVPALSYVAFIFPALQHALNEKVVRILSALGLTSALIALLVIF